MVKLKNAKQERFCHEYVVDNNAKEAAIRAGYSPRSAKQTGHRMLTYDDCKARVDELQAKVAANTLATAEYVLKGLKLVADRCTQGVEVRDNEGNPTGEWRFDSSGANRALELLGKHYKLFTEVSETNDKSMAQIVSEMRKERVEREREKQRTTPVRLARTG